MKLGPMSKQHREAISRGLALRRKTAAAARLSARLGAVGRAITPARVAAMAKARAYRNGNNGDPLKQLEFQLEDALKGLRTLQTALRKLSS